MIEGQAYTPLERMTRERDVAVEACRIGETTVENYRRRCAQLNAEVRILRSKVQTAEAKEDKANIINLILLCFLIVPILLWVGV
jgi:hypothetical protein